MIKKILFIMLLDGSSIIYAQDSTFVKTVFAGSMLKVPKDKTWVIEKAFINAGDGYNVKINNANFKTLYNQKETLVVPSYIAEMELLDDKKTIWYQLYIKQTNTSR
jgi:hypothetical protein